MGQYLRQARHHAERIEYFHRHAGSAGHKQATYHYDQLCRLIDRASQSKNDKNDAVVIATLREPAAVLMGEMLERAENEG
jgi:hypothetical protein